MGGTSYEKLGGQNIFAAAPTIPVPPLIRGTCPFCPPVETMHAATIMSLKAMPIQLSVDTVLTSGQIH